MAKLLSLSALGLLSLLSSCTALKNEAQKFHFSNVFGSHMVLQHSKPVPIWGWDTPGHEISTNFNGQKYSARANINGFWKIVLPAMPPSLTAYSVSVSNNNNEIISLDDVLFGDVFLCSGQSNMEYTVNFAVGGTEEVQNANNFPFIRLTSGPLQGVYDLGE